MAQGIQENNFEALDARVHTELVRMGVNPVTPTDMAKRIKIATRQKVTGSLMRLRTQGKAQRFDDGTWCLRKTIGPKKEQTEPIAEIEMLDVPEIEVTPTGNISGGDLWDAYYAAVKASDDKELDGLLNESGRALLDGICDKFPNPGEAIAFVKGFLTGINLSKKA